MVRAGKKNAHAKCQFKLNNVFSIRRDNILSLLAENSKSAGEFCSFADLAAPLRSLSFVTSLHVQ